MNSLQSFYEHHYPKVIALLTQELDSRYTYHGLRHTQDVIEQCVQIGQALGCSEEEIDSLKIAALFHDLGFLNVRKGHEEESAKMFRASADGVLALNFIEIISSCILATTMPQNPKNKLEQIICDADLDYLGRGDFPAISLDLFNEMLACGELDDQRKWDEIQVVFLDKHQFHTAYNQERRNQQKQQHLLDIKKRINV